MRRRLLSVSLAFVIVFSVFLSVPHIGTTAIAATNGHILADAISWLDEQIGQQIGNGQCPALARAYYAYLGYDVSGDGKAYENNVPDGWSRTYYSQGYIPKPGDIAVWRTTNTDLGKIYGHVAIVQSADSDHMICYEQGKSAEYIVRTYPYSYDSVTCFISPDWSVPEITTGTLVTFGSYPQTEVKDEATKTALNALLPEWDNWSNYGYYSGNGSSGSGKPSDYMKYADVNYNRNKYRAVKFTSYRPHWTQGICSADDSYQDEYGYHTDTVYWFKYEPIVWCVLDPAEGLLMTESIIDSQAFETIMMYTATQITPITPPTGHIPP